MTEGANRVGIANGVTRNVEAFAQIVGVSDDESLHLMERAIVLEEAIVEFAGVCGCGEFHVLRAFRGVAAGAPGLAPDGVVES